MVPVKRKSTTYWRTPKAPLLATIMRRWWLLLMPFLGSIFADAYVSPYVADAESAVNKIKKAEADRLEELDAEFLTRENELFAVEMSIDTLTVPEYEWAKSTHDSLVAVRRGIEQTFPTLEAGIARLTEQLEELKEPLEQATLNKAEAERAIDEHTSNIAALQDSITTLGQEQQTLRDRLYRLEHPEEFDRTRGLIDPGRPYK